MILKLDKKQLEWRTYLEWSRDPVGVQEIIDDVDVHSDNQVRFVLPTRVTAKIFLFRWIYRGSAWAYANDADFMATSASQKFWQKVIDAANEKYNVLYEFQNRMIREVEKEGRLVIPTGREFKFELHEGKNGEWYWNVRDIVNWPNQGFAADLMIICRVSLMNRLRKFREWDQGKILLFNTVHDDVEVDVDNDPDLCYNVSITMEEVAKDVPSNFQKLYKKEFLVPLAGEVSFGKNLGQLNKFKRELGPDQFRI